MILKILKSIFTLALLGYAILWIFSYKTYEVELGLSYSPHYARFLGLDHDTTYDAILSDLRPSTIRLAAPWSEVEPAPGVFDYSEIDEMVKKAGDSGIRIIMTVGQKVPRWPECYIPEWAGLMDKSSKKEALLGYVERTILRYKDNPSIEFWQAENEPFIRFPFGECVLFDMSAVKDEVALIRTLDPEREIIMTDSGELSTFRRPSFSGDIIGTTVYRTIRIKGGSIVKYDWLPPAFYKFRARLWGNDQEHFFVSELQAEPWFFGEIPKDKESIEKDETFSIERFRENIEYSKKVGASRAYLWGVEWWYFMKEKAGDSSYWDEAREVLRK